MEKSDNIGDLAAALSKFHGAVSTIPKLKQGYGYKYADLAQVLEIVYPLLDKCGLAVSQHVEEADVSVTITTILMHSSNQWLQSTLKMPVERSKANSAAQCSGSIITYGRRYTTASILLLAQCDADASPKSVNPGVVEMLHLCSQFKDSESVVKYICGQLKISDIELAPVDEIPGVIKLLTERLNEQKGDTRVGA